MNVSLTRLYLLRAVYLFVTVGFGSFLLPTIVQSSHAWDFTEGAMNCMLVTFWLLCVVGLRYPLHMLPMLMWELIWKSIWLALVALPQWVSGHMDANVQANLFACSLVVVIPLVMPWRYVYANYVRRAGEPWRVPAMS